MHAIHSVAKQITPDPLIGIVPPLGGDFDQASSATKVDLEPLVRVVASRYPGAVRAAPAHGVEATLVGGVAATPHGGSREAHVWQAVVLRSQRNIAAGLGGGQRTKK